MAEDAVFREAAAEGALEGVDVVDALADERTFAEYILIDIRHRPGVRVDAGFAAIEPGQARTVGAGQADRHPRLQDAVAADHALAGFVIARTIERMRHGADELARGIARQLRVGVERDDVADPGQRRRIADHQRKGVARPATQQGVQCGQFAALALMAHPDAFLRIPAARAMEQEKDVGCG